MTTMDNFDDSTRCVLSIIEQGALIGTAVNMQFELTEYDISGGDKEFETEANLAGGRIKNHSPQSDIEISLKGKFTDATAYGLINTVDADALKSIGADDNRTTYHLAILHTEDLTFADSAFAASGAGSVAERDTYFNGEFTAVSKSYSGQKMEYTLKFKCPPKNKQAVSNWLFESTDGVAELPVVTLV